MPAGPTEALPAWLGGLAEPLPTRAPEGWLRLRVPVALTATLAVAASLCLVWRSAQSGLDASPEYDTAKGLPAVAVYVNHDGRVGLWNGDALATGDSIRLEVAAEDFVHVSVVLDAGEHRQVLYQGPVQAHARVLLPKAWQLDDAARSEHLSVLFSREALTRERAEALLTATTLDQTGAYLVQLTLPKRGR
jgi:hypothetical protein